MNRFKIHILAMGAACLGLASCSESYLDTEPITSATTANFYKTENDAYRALIGCYDGWQCSNSNGIAFYVASEVMSDECLGGTGTGDDRKYQVIDRFDINQYADQNLFNATWTDYYAAVYRCNMLLQYENQIEWKNETTRGTYMGECRTLRALCYFDMVRLWENIPLLKVATTENVAQAPADSVYALIVEDLKYAINNIPKDAYPKASAATNDGRITKYAAEALLARVYLYYTGYYGKDLAGITKDDVVGALKDIIESKEFDLVDEFRNLWPAASTTLTATVSGDETVYGVDAEKTTYAGDGNREVILAQKFNNTQSYSNSSIDANRWLVMLGMRDQYWSPYGQGWGCATVNPKMWEAYKAGDTRKAASIISFVSEGLDKNKDYAKGISKWREFTGYCIKKYTPLAFPDGKSASKPDGSGDMQISQHQDYVVIRYADVLLMAAELGLDAQENFNKVRKRAYQTTDEKGALVISSNYTELVPTKENLMNERMLEFAFEGIRYWDLLRQGIDYAASQIATSGISTTSGDIENPDIVTITAENIKSKKGLIQIPGTQITLSNNLLKQNAGW